MAEHAEKRSDYEAEFSRRLARAVDAIAAELRGITGSGEAGSLRKLHDSIWEPWRRLIGDEAYWPLILAYIDSSDELESLFGSSPAADDSSEFAFGTEQSPSRRGLAIPDTSAETQRRADEFARQRSAELAKSIISGIADRVERPLKMPADDEPTPIAAADIFGESRIERVAISETTNAISAGETGAANRLRTKLGWDAKATWRTERDSRVCPICNQFDGEDSDYFVPRIGYPPAHPSCRCWLQWSAVRKPEPEPTEELAAT